MSRKYELEKCNHRNLVTKSNELISANYYFSLYETRIIICIASTVNPYNDDFPLDHEIKVKEFAEIFNLESDKDVYRKLKETLKKRLWFREIELFDQKKQEKIHVRWFDEIRYSDKNGVIKFSFSPKIKPYLCQLSKNFTSYYLYTIVNFKSSYSIRMYEFCILEINKQKKNKCEFIIELYKLKESLDLHNKYSKFSHFKSRILEKARSEINAYSDLIMDYEEIRKGRSVDSIKFFVERKKGCKPATYKQEGQRAITCQSKEIEAPTPNPQESINVGANMENSTTCAKDNENTSVSSIVPKSEIKSSTALTLVQTQSRATLKYYGIEHKLAENLVLDHGVDIVNTCVDKLHKEIEAGRDINNVSGYLVKCIQNYKQNVKSNLIKQEIENEKIRKREEERRREERWQRFDKMVSAHEEEILILFQHKMTSAPITSEETKDFLDSLEQVLNDYQDIASDTRMLSLAIPFNGKYANLNYASLVRLVVDLKS